MSGWEQTVKYRCDSDCREGGCPGHEVVISSGPKSTATITVRSDGHTDVFSVPQSPLLKRQAGPTSTK